MTQKSILLMVSTGFIFLSSTMYCAEQENHTKWNNLKAEQDYLKSQQENSIQHQVGKELLKGGINGFSSSISGSVVEWAKKELEYQYDGRQTKLEKLQVCNHSITFVNNAIDLIPKQAQATIEQINLEINEISSKRLSAKNVALEIERLKKEKDNIRLQAKNDIKEMGELLQDLKAQYKDLQKQGNRATPNATKDNSIELPNSEQPFENNNNNKNDTDNVKVEVQENDSPDNESGFIKKAYSIIVPACAASINFLAEKCGPKKCAELLAANAPYFKGKETLISNTLTVTGLAVLGVALYNTYHILTSENDEEEDEDIFKKFNRKKYYKKRR